MKKVKKLVIVVVMTLLTVNISAKEKTGFMSNIKQLKEISDIMDIVQENFVGDKEINKEILMQGALRGMIES